MWIGTFHGLCNRFLRTHYRDAALPQAFQILDSQDQLSMIKRLLKANNVDDEKYPAKNLLYFINNAKDQGLRANKVEAYDPIERKMVELYELYDMQCQREGVVDFAELLLRSFELLQRNQPLREHYQARFKHILVDEFQDTNDLQYNLLKLLAGHGEQFGGALFAVGDDDQSIYAFRGANVGNMSAFEREFRVENLIKLEQNYRSHGHILDSANQLIANNSKRLGKNLRTDAGHGEQVRIYEASSDLEEAQWLIEEIKSLVADGAARSEIAILYRSNAQSRVIEHALFAAGLPYTVYGGQRYFQRAEVKHAIAYLQLMDNPHNDSAFLRVVNFPTRGIGMRSIETLQAAAEQYGISLYAAVPYVTGKSGSSLGSFVKLIEGARFETQQLALPEMVRVVLEASGLLTHYGNEKEGADRIENLEQMVNAATQFVQEEGFGQGAPAHLGPRARRAGRRSDPQPGRHRDPRRRRAAADRDVAAVGLPVARLAGSGRRPGAGRPGLGAADDGALGQGPRIRRRVHHRAGRGPVPAREQFARDGRRRRRAAPDVRGDHARQEAPVHELHAAAHAARPDPLQHEVALFRRVAGRGAQVDVAAGAVALVRQQEVGVGRRQVQQRRLGQQDRPADHPEAGRARLAHRRIGRARQVRRRRDRQYRRQRRQCARADQFRPRRHEGARPVGGQAGAGRALA